MNPPIFVTAPTVQLPPPQSSSAEVADLLRQLLEVQKEQFALQKSQAAAQDGLSRWRAFLARWQSDFPNIGLACKQVLPSVERAYLTMMRELTDRLLAEDSDDLDNEFALAEFLDRYGVRLGQLGTILGQLGPLADAAPLPEKSGS